MSRLIHTHHVFVPVGDGVYIVKCLQTGGSFSTLLWRDGRQPQQKCPCCQEIVKHGN